MIAITINATAYVQVTSSHDYGVTTHYVYLNTYDMTKETTLEKFTLSDDSNSNSSQKIRLEKGTYYVMVKGYGSQNAQYNFVVNTVSGDSKPTTTKQTPTATKKPTTTKIATRTTTSPSGDEKTTTRVYHTIPNGDPITPDDINNNGTYKYITNSESNTIVVIIIKYIGNDDDVYIPEKIDGLMVVGLADEAFAGTTVRKVFIPDGVYQYGSNVFDSGVLIICSPGSPAESYAKANNLETSTDDDNHGPDSDTNSAGKTVFVITIIVIAVLIAAIICAIYYIKSNNKNNSRPNGPNPNNSFYGTNGPNANNNYYGMYNNGYNNFYGN